MNGTTALREILERFRFVEPIPQKTKNVMLKEKPKILISLLKNAGVYTLADSLILSLYFAFERAGIRISYRTSRIVLSISSVILALLVAVAVYFAIAKIHPIAHITPAIEEIVEQKKATQETKPPYKEESKTPAAIIAPSPPILLGIQRFDAADVEETEAIVVSKALYDALTLRKGTENVVWYDGETKKNIKYMLRGSVSKIGDAYRLNVRLLSVETAEIRHIEGKAASTIDELALEGAKIAERIAEKIK